MNQPKKRGRPFKTEPQIVKPAPVVDSSPEAVSAAQAYAERIWAGQSDSVTRIERIRRVKLALEGQNLPFEGVVL